MILKIALAVSVAIAAFLTFATTRPNSFRVQRSITIRARQEGVFTLINNLRSWEAWSLDSAEDRTTQRIYRGPASGTGAAAEWHGSGRSGAATMMITDSAAPNRVFVKVDWLKPFEAHNLNEFALHARGRETEVTWTIKASNLYPMKVIGIFVDMQREFGRHMESALGKLKVVAESMEAGSSPETLPGH